MYNDLEEDLIKDPHVPKSVIWKLLVPPSLASQHNLSPSQTDWSCQTILKPVLFFPFLLQLLSFQIQTFNWTSFLLLPFASLS